LEDLSNIEENLYSGSDEISLAILHPFKLSVYSVSKLAGQVEHGSQYKVNLVYEHKLKRHSFNMCCGPFGHGPSETKKEGSTTKRNRRFICVQSLDGTLSFFEQELFTFCRYLPGFLLPGQLAYAPSWDSFLTITSWNVVCFKYTSLAMAKDDPYLGKTM
jgi:Bardet-Biedl syndrome 9 protein